MIDEAALERACIHTLQAANHGAWTAPRADSADRASLVSTVAAVGWMYMDLERATVELEQLCGWQREEGYLPRAPGETGAALPLLASILRMVYHAARSRHRAMESRLAALVPAVDRHHAWFEAHSKRHLAQTSPDDEQLVLEADEAGDGPMVQVNALLVQADSDLADVGIHTGFPTRTAIARRTRRAQAMANRMWRAERSSFSPTPDSRCVNAAGLLTLWSGTALGPQARSMVGAHLAPGKPGMWTTRPLATRSSASPGFAADRPGRGALDPVVNWLLVRGLYRYGWTDEASQLQETLLGCAAAQGLRPAYHAHSGEGLGPDGWVPTAALVLDLLKTPYYYDRW